MRLREADPAEALPAWWLWSAAASCVACVVLFGIALALDSVAMGFAALLVLLIGATVLPIAWRRRQNRQTQQSEAS